MGRLLSSPGQSGYTYLGYTYRERPLSRGLGKLQRTIKDILQKAGEAKLGWMTFADIRGIFIMHAGGNPETDKMLPNFERSLKRSLKALVDCADVLRRGKGGQQTPFAYMTIEVFMDEPDTDKAKREFVEMTPAAANLRAP